MGANDSPSTVDPLDDLAAATHIRALLDGSSSNGTPLKAFGKYRDVIEVLQQAFAADGTAKVREVWKELVRRNPEVARLVSGDQLNGGPQVCWTAAQLLGAVFPPIKWVVPDLLSEGLAVLAGRPKLGKSWLALQIAQAVASAGRVFEHTIEPGAVLYIALEDSERRLQKRMQLQCWPPSARTTFYTAWKPLDAGGIPDLEEQMETKGYRLLVIDTLSRALSGRRNQNEVGEMTLVFSRLQRLALEHHAAILLVDHHSKPKGMEPDPIDDILGSTAKGAAADILMGLYRKRGDRSATLKVVGRDLDQDKNLALDWDAHRCCWYLHCDAAAVIKGSLQGAVLDAFAQLSGEATTTAIAEFLGKDKGNISREIAELVQKGRLSRGQKQGRDQLYQLPWTVKQEANEAEKDAP